MRQGLESFLKIHFQPATPPANFRADPPENLRAASPTRQTTFGFSVNRSTRFVVPHPTRSSTTANMSAPSLNKIAANSASRQNPSELESGIATALYELETNTADLKVALRPLQFVSAREVRIH